MPRKPKEYYVEVRTKGGKVRIGVTSDKVTQEVFDALDRVSAFAVDELLKTQPFAAPKS